MKSRPGNQSVIIDTKKLEKVNTGDRNKFNNFEKVVPFNKNV